MQEAIHRVDRGDPTGTSLLRMHVDMVDRAEVETVDRVRDEPPPQPHNQVEEAPLERVQEEADNAQAAAVRNRHDLSTNLMKFTMTRRDRMGHACQSADGLKATTMVSWDS